MVAAPGATPLTTPETPDTVAIAGLEEVQDADPVRFWVLPSAKLPVAVN